ncbi:hypothetical protein NHX12_014870 [Muraenolepis orangiensis]|uniref:Uncharacterized protein n=1 Tax=Muraenolepis orangiensis TaxID=630683 RepID=A0A9Q0DCB9_9TELE|nr:hypothetical protein NHX12_014870 [Muraenolepis orangiensis]
MASSQVWSPGQRKSFNVIPSGRELPRTPPMSHVKHRLSFADEVCPATVCSGDAFPMLRGMGGYQLTQTDQDFIEKMNQEKLQKNLQGELADLESSINREAMALDLHLSSKEKALEGLDKFPTCETMVDLARTLLSQTVPAGELDQLDHRSLLASVTEAGLRRAISEKKRAVDSLKEGVRKKEEKQENEILERKHEIQGLMIQLAGLKCEVAKERESRRSPEGKTAAAQPVRASRAPRSNKSATTATASARQRSQSAGKSGATKATSRRTRAPGPTASPPAATKTGKAAAIVTETAAAQSVGLRRSKRIATRK